MALWTIILLAIVQGLTEFLPVSSSGHLVVANAVLEALGYQPAPDLLEVEIVLHLGTLLAVLIFFWRDIWQVVRRDWRVVPLLAVGTLPAVAVGLPVKQFAEPLLESPLLAGCMFPLTAAMLLWSSRQPQGDGPYRELSYGAAFKVGLLQALAILPGISRSGATIAGGLVEGLDRRSAGVFAFLLAIPAIGGAGLLQMVDLVAKYRAAAGDPALAATHTDPLTLFLGAMVAMLVGLAALWLLLRWVQQGRLAMFAWYLIPLGVVVIAWQLVAAG